MRWRNWFQKSIPPNIGSITFNPMATEQDVEACYRLFLGRLPDPDGGKTFKNWVNSASVPVKRLMEEFLESPEFRQRYLISVVKSDPYQWVDLQGFGIYASPEDPLIGSAIVKSQYEPHVRAMLEATIKPGMTAIDIGANIGYFSMVCAALVGEQGRVIAFEPGHKNGQSLLLSAQRNGFDQILLYPFAVAEKKATFIFDLDGLTGTNGAIYPLPALGELETTLNLSAQATQPLVQAVTIDETLSHLDRVDLIKIDVEGFELRALSGAKQLIQRHRPIIATEFSPGALSQMSGCSGEDYLQFLIDLGYQISVLTPNQAPQACETIAQVMDVYHRKAVDHIDLLAQPVNSSSSSATEAY